MESIAGVDDRGQILLIGALTLAVSLVAIALLLNSAIYTHNLASRAESPAKDAVTFARDSRLAAGGLLEYANERYADEGWTVIKDNYVAGLGDIESGLQRDFAVNSRIIRVGHVAGSATTGIRIADTEPGGSTFVPATNPSGNQNWTVAPDVRARRFKMRVDASTLNTLADTDVQSLLGDSLLDTGFVVVFDSGNTEWQVALYNSGSNTVSLMIHEVGTTVYETCSTSRPEALIEFTDAEVNHETCEPLSAIRGLAGAYTIHYYNGNLAAGSYELIADRSIATETDHAGPFTDVVDDQNYGTHCAGPTYHAATSQAAPTVAPIIYATELRTTYDGPQTTYRATQRVAPGETTPANTPRILTWNVSEPPAILDAGNGKFDVSWDVMDPDGPDSAVDVTVTVVEPDGQTKTFTGLGTGDGSTSIDVDDELGTFTIRLTVDDGPDDTAVDGHSRTVVQSHEDDGDNTGCPP